MASLTGNLVAETYKALLKTIDNDILTASEKQITDGFGGGSNVFIDSNGFLRANKYKVTNGLATQFLKADGSLDANTYLTSINSSQIIAALGFTPVTNARTLTINGTTYDLSANRSWTVAGTAAIWGNITGTLSNQTDLQNALNAKFNNPAGTISQYIRGDGSLATFPTLPGGLPIGGTAGQILAKINSTDYNAEWIDNFATQTKNEVKLGQTLAKGAAVYVSSANGTNIIVSAASNTTEALSSKTFGLLETGGVLNDFVKCVTFGLLAGLDTSTATAGDPVWLGVNGALIFGLANKPVAPAHLVYIGVVTRVQSNNGEIFVNVQNGFELNEIHDVLITSVANNQGLFYESATSLWKNKSIATVLGYTPQAQLSGTGFVKASGTTISYDNSTYLTTTDAATTYQRLDKMVSNLLASATEYPNSNAVITALALKADAANPVFTGNMTISGAEPKLTFTDTDQNPDYFIGVDAGFFRIYDQTAGATRLVINSSGDISTNVTNSFTAGSIIKSGGLATEFLKADGSVDSSTYVTSATLANYLLSATAATTYQTLANLSTDLTASATKYPSVNAVVTGLGTKQPLDADLTAIAALVGTTGFLIKTAADTWSLDTNTYLTTASAASTYLTQTTAASTYQRLDKMVSNLLASSTEYPNSNAVLAKLALKADAANPVFTGDLSISGATPRLYFVDTDQNPDYTVFIDSGFFYIYDQTAGATRFSINSSGNISTGVGKTITTSELIVDKVSGVSTITFPAGTNDPGFIQHIESTANTGIMRFSVGDDNDSNDYFAFGNNNVPDAFRINAMGTVSIGVWQATAIADSYISSAATWNAKQSTITLTTTGSSGAATFTSNTLNIPNYGSALSGYLPLTGGTLTGTLNGTIVNSSNYSRFYNIGIGGAASGTYAAYSDAVIGFPNLHLVATTGGAVYVNSAIALPFYINPVGGNVIIGALTDSGFKLDVIGTGRFNAGSNTDVLKLQSTASTNADLWLYDASTTAGNVRLRSVSNSLILISGGLSSLTLASTGAATFLSTSNRMILFNSSNANGPYVGWQKSGSDEFYIGKSNSIAGGSGFYDIYANAAGGGLRFYTNGNGSSAMTISTSNYVGIGTNTPARPLTVVSYLDDGAINSGGNVYSNAYFGTGGLMIGTISTTGNSVIMNNTNRDTIFGNWNGSTNAERIRITAGGNLLIGTSTDSGYKLDVNGTLRVVSDINYTSGAAIYPRTTGVTDWYLSKHNGTLDRIENAVGTNRPFTIGNHIGSTYTANIFFNGGGSATFNSSVTATAFFESSDSRLKTLIDASGQIAGIENLEAKLYEKNGKIELGYFAQDAQEFMPYSVEKNMDGFLSLSYREVHTAKIARLEQRVAELEKQLNAA